MSEKSIKEMKACVAWTFNVVSKGKPVVTEKEYYDAFENVDGESYGLPDFEDFEKEVLDMDTFVNVFCGAVTTPGAVPEKDLPEMIASVTRTFTSLAKDLGKPVPGED